MSRSSSTVASGVALALLLISHTALAQGIYGVSSGLVLNAPTAPAPVTCPAGTCCTGTNLTVSEGTYYLAGTPYAVTHPNAPSQVYNTCGYVDGGVNNCLQPPMEVGVALTLNKAYYCYEESGPGLICTTTTPYPNGQPSAPVETSAMPLTHSQNMIFVGSFVTDPNSCIIPSARLGEYVIFKPGSTISNIYVDAGFSGHQYAFNAGVAACSWPQVGAAVNCKNLSGAVANSVAPYYPKSASAGIFDIHVINSIESNTATGASNNQLIQFYDPTPYYAVGTSSVQAEIAVSGTLTQLGGNSVPELVTERVTLNLNQFPPPYSAGYDWSGGAISAGQFGSPTPSVPAGDAVIAVLRGYIEPIQRLSSR